jgi:hypothetical protein
MKEKLNALAKQTKEKLKDGLGHVSNLSAKTLLLVTLAIGATSCEKDDPMEPPVDPTPTNAAPVNTLTFTVADLDGDGKLNDLVAKHTATDSDGTIDYKEAVLKMGNTEIASFDQNTQQEFKDVDNGTYTVTAESTDNDGADDTDTITQTVNVDTPNTAPTINVTINGFDENTPIGTVVGNINANDADGDTLTYTITTGDDKFELDGTDIKTKVDFDFEDANNAHTITVEVSDGTDTADDTQTANEGDVTEVLNFVDRPDVTYTKTAVLGGGTVTEDLSHLDAADTRNAERVVDLADNDPNNQTLQTQLRVADNGGNEVWVDKQVQINKVANAGLGDATALAMANAYRDGVMGMANFDRTTTAEQNANNDALLKLNNIIQESVAYRNSVSVLDTEWGATNAHYDGAPSNFTNPTDIRLCRQTRIYFVIWGQLMHGVDITNADNVRSIAAKALSMAEAMTDQEMYDFYLEKIYGGNVTAFENFWGN